MNIMVTGAAGGYGSAALTVLKDLVPTATLYGLVRHHNQVATLEAQGVHARLGDYADAGAMVAAFKGIDRVLFVSTPQPDIQQNVVQAAKTNHVSYIAYTSIYAPDLPQFGLEISHRQTEQWLRDSGLHYTILRNAWYTRVQQGLINLVAKTHQLPYFSGDGVISSALRREYAEAGARVIVAATASPIVTLAGKPYTYPELGTAIGTALGAPVTSTAVSETETKAQLTQAGVDATLVGMAVAYQDYTRKGQNGEAVADPTEFERILGHPLTPLAAAVKELLP